MRTIINLPDEQVRRLAEVCRRDRLSRAEVIRRAVAEYLAKRESLEREEAFGIWRDRGDDGLDYERRLRREWS